MLYINQPEKNKKDRISMVLSLSTQEVWTKLEDRATSSEEITEIARHYPEFSQAIAIHPNASPDVRAWAQHNATFSMTSSNGMTRQRTRASSKKFTILAYGFIAAFVIRYLLFLVRSFLHYSDVAPTFQSVFAIAAPLVVVLVIGVAFVVDNDNISNLARPALAIGVLLPGAIMGSFQFWFVDNAPTSAGMLFSSVSNWLMSFGFAAAFAIARPVRGFGWVGVSMLAILPVPVATITFRMAAFFDLITVWDRGWYTATVTMIISVVCLLIADSLSTVSQQRIFRSEPLALTDAAHHNPSPRTENATNTLAILSLVLSFFVNIAGVVLGHVALSQIRQTGESGRTLAIAGLVVGYLSIGFITFMLFLYFAATFLVYI